MKFSLSYAGPNTTLSQIQPIVNAAGGNTTVFMDTVQIWLAANLASLVQSAGNTKNLRLAFNGAQSSLALVQPVVTASGTNTTITMNTAQSPNWTPANLAALLQSAGNTKNLSLDFNGAQSNLTLIQPVVSAAGTKTAISVNTIQSPNWTAASLAALLQSAGNTKNLSLDFNGAQSSLALVQPVVTASGTNTTITMNTAQSPNWSTSDLTTLEQSAGSTKKLNLSFNGSQSNLTELQAVINAAGTNTNISINVAQTLTAAGLATLEQSAGNTKNLTLNFNAAQSNVSVLQSVVNAAGTNITINMNSSQTWTASNLSSLLQNAGSAKKLRLNFEGAYTNMTLLQSVVTAAGTNTSISLNEAYHWLVNDLITLEGIAG